MVDSKLLIEPEAKFKEKKKWQIALRRYVLEKKLSPNYAPYFGLEIEKMRKWVECQFVEGIGWDDFAVKWQFDHVIPVTYFDFNNEDELKMCWSFLNIRVGIFNKKEEKVNRIDLVYAKNYFKDLYKSSNIESIIPFLDKIEGIILSKKLETNSQTRFLIEQKSYLSSIKGFSAYEYEMLNRGGTLEQVKKEMEILKKFT